MKHNKSFLFAALTLLSVSSLAACSSGRGGEEDWEEPTYEVGESVRKWSSK